MTINAYPDNPVVRDRSDYDKLEEAVKSVAPHLSQIWLHKDKVTIQNLSTRSFRYPKRPTIEWIVGRVKYMKENNL